MKRTSLVLTLLAVLALVAAACGGDSGGGGGGGEGAQGRDAEVDASLCPVDTLEAASADGPVQIEFWHAMTASNEETLNTMIDDYNASQDAVEVTGVFSGSYDETLDKYLTGLRSGELPQLVQLEETTLQTMIDSGSTVPAAACVAASDYDTSDILPSVLAEFEVEGTLWPMPFNVSNPVFYYDRNDFTAAGLDPDAPPATLDEMYDMGQTIVEAGAAEHAMSLEVQPWYPEQWMSMAGETLVDNTNGRDARAEAATVDNATMIDIFTWIREMVDNDLIFNVGRNPSGADHFFALASGDAAFTIGTSGALGSVYDALDSGTVETDVDIGIGPLPGPVAGGPTSAGGAALSIVANGSSPGADRGHVGLRPVPGRPGPAGLLAREHRLHPDQLHRLRGRRRAGPVGRSPRLPGGLRAAGRRQPAAGRGRPGHRRLRRVPQRLGGRHRGPGPRQRRPGGHRGQPPGGGRHRHRLLQRPRRRQLIHQSCQSSQSVTMRWGLMSPMSWSTAWWAWWAR